MFSTPLICCSSGVATDPSTSVALAPMNVVVTWIIGGTISGYWAIGRPRMATTPSRTVMIEITIATIGRLTKKRATGLPRTAGGRRRVRLVLVLLDGRLGADRHAVLHALQAADDDAVAFLHAVLEHPE